MRKRTWRRCFRAAGCNRASYRCPARHSSACSFQPPRDKPRAALRIADRADVMETGHVVLAGSATQLLHDPQVQRACPGA